MKITCDFCNYPDVRHVYEADDFVIARGKNSALASIGSYWFCEECYRLIEANDRDGLVQRAWDRLLEDKPQPQGVPTQLRKKLQGQIRLIQTEFFKHKRRMKVRN